MANEKENSGGLFNFLDGSFLGGLVEAGVNWWQNKENREWSSEEAQHNRDFQTQMYERQLDDSIAWRTHQEDYNSPEAMMQRYRDAGINPMYVVAGAGGANMVSTPMQANGSGYGSSVPSPNQHRLSFAEAFRMRNEARLTEANVKLIESEAREHNANAQSIEDGLPKSGYYREVWEKMRNIWSESSYGWQSSAEMEAQFMHNARLYQLDLQGLGFEDAKGAFLHSAAVRKFSRELEEHQRDLFEHELTQAKSAAEVYRVSAKWAERNQAIGAGVSLVGAATGFVQAVKRPGGVTNTTHNYGSNERHIYGDQNINPQTFTYE